MTWLEYIKAHGNLDQIIVLLKERRVTDAHIMTLLEIPKQTIYNARERQKPLLDAMQAGEPLGYGDKDVWAITERFKNNFGTTKTTKQDRYAAHRLAKKHGTEDILRVITALAQCADQPFAPGVNSVSQLDAKLPSVILFLKKQESISTVIGSL